MELKRLSLFNFKNYHQAELEPDPSCNAFVGNNGEGKTNLLDAIHYLSLCKSYFNPVDSQNIRQQEDVCMIQGVFAVDEREESISCSLRRNQRKIVRRNQKEYERLADHIGWLPVVMIAPTDTHLITEGSEERRRFLDSIISQFDRRYLDDLMNYNRILLQRNALLKRSAQQGGVDEATLEVLDAQMAPAGNRIYNARKSFVDQLGPVFLKNYSFISGGKEVVELVYESQLNDLSFSDLMLQARNRDRASQFSTTGIHKDDLGFLLNGRAVKRFASQGQQKSYLVALKLAQFDFMRDRLHVKPLLLLDDIFDKLDDLRVARLMELVSDDHFGQIFVTDTHPERIREIFERIGQPIRVFMVEEGGISLQQGIAPVNTSQHA